jgi:D-beta-D-heptose 7-phosphate kinase / D-beta-D-heptose 1-phosphate adenosyltransferase
MPENLTPLIQSFAGINALVIGDAMLDVYLHGTTNRLCREAPVPIVALDDSEEAPGGCANTAANLRALGANVSVIAAAGDDDEGRRLCHTLVERGIDCDGLITTPGWQTLTKTRVVASGQMMLRFDQGGSQPLPPQVVSRLRLRLEEAFATADVVVVSDYGYGVLCDEVVQKLGRLHESNRTVLVVDGKDPWRYHDLHPTAIKPNYEEAVRLLGKLPPRTAQRSQAVAALGDAILQASGADIAAVTLDTEGAMIFENGRPPYRTYARPTSDTRAAGAGDTFVAALGLALAAGADTPAAAELASAAANFVVCQEGTTTCSAEALVESFTSEAKVLADPARLALRLDLLRHQGRRIVFTNGCFDILHRGHVAYLNAAKAIGDVLVVGVNSDDSVARLKGPERPINSLDDRLQILAALSCIDFLAPFEGDTPVSLIEAVRPDVFVKGGDYTRETLPEAKLVESLGGRIELLPLVEERSTTRIISRIRAAPGG